MDVIVKSDSLYSVQNSKLCRRERKRSHAPENFLSRSFRKCVSFWFRKQDPPTMQIDKEVALSKDVLLMSFCERCSDRIFY
jgi:hypothetical protein